MIKVGDTVIPIDAPTFVRGKVEDIHVVNGTAYADIGWNKPGYSRRMLVSKIKKIN